ncbi:MAG: hypothetical protein RIQ93_855 [Verrucomicrobiota bacterium]|jgi:hypothetical protein
MIPAVAAAGRGATVTFPAGTDLHFSRRLWVICRLH